MRIVAGEFGGRVLRAPLGHSTRPTSEKVREALFSILGPPGPGACVLDPFGGAGGLGLEALSRGALHVTFAESARPALAALRENIASLGVGERVVVLPGDGVRAAATSRPPPALARHWRWVLIDPPYASDLAVRAAEALAAEALADTTEVVIEHDRRNPPPDTLGTLLRTDLRRYGDTLLSFYRPRSEKPWPP